MMELLERSDEFFAAMKADGTHGELATPQLRALLGGAAIHAWFAVTDYHLAESGLIPEMDVIVVTAAGVLAFGTEYVPEPEAVGVSTRFLPWRCVTDLRVLTTTPATDGEVSCLRPVWVRLIFGTDRITELFSALAPGDEDLGAHIDVRMDFISMSANANTSGQDAVDAVLECARAASVLLNQCR